MKRFFQLYSLLSIASFFAFLPKAVYAISLCANGSSGGTNFSALCNLTIDNNSTIVGKIITILLILAIILALIFLIWGGIKWIMSGGDKQKIEQARAAIIGAIIGLVLAFLAYFILNVVTFFITGGNFTTLTLPTLF